jgi:hypothetical protein
MHREIFLFLSKIIEQMKSKMLIASLLLLAWNAPAQKNLLEKVKVNAGFIAEITATCGAETNKWSYKDGITIRHYDNGFEYTLIDTGGLFIYVKQGGEAFFSKDACGEIYHLNYHSLKKSFKDYDDFAKALKREKDDALALPAGADDITLANSLYRKYVRAREIEEMPTED